MVNNTRSIMSMGRYVKLIEQVVNSRTRFVTITYDRNFSKNFVIGEELKGWKWPLTNGWTLNRIFQGIVYRKKFREFANNDAVHYVNPSIYPFTNDASSIVTIPDLIPFKKEFRDKKPNLPERRLFYRYKNFENILCSTNYVKNELINFGFSGRIEAIPLPPDSVFRPLEDKIHLRKELGLPLEKKLILSVSLNIKRKNLGLVKDVMSALGTDYHLVRVGTGVGNSTNFANVNDETLNKIYNACDILFFPSIEEGYGLPVIEAFSVGIPVVAADIEVMQEIGKDAAKLVEPSITESMNGIREIVNNREEFINRGFQKAREFSLNNFKLKMRRYYSRVLEGYF